MSGVRRHRVGGRVARGGFAALALLAALALAGCGAEAIPSATPAPTPTPTPVPTATPLPGLPLAAGYRPDGDWLVLFSRPGDIVREVFTIALTCPDGACDAIVRITAADGADLGKGTFELRDDRYVHSSTTSGPVDCVAAGKTVRGGATATVSTELVLATYRIAGTAVEDEGIQGTRVVTLEPDPGSGCEASTTVYPATGEPATDRS